MGRGPICRKRIARDLHDDLNQRLALLSVEMALFGADSKDTTCSARERLESMTSQVKGLSSEVHRLSYQLHPAKLDQLGLVVAARTFCREVSVQAGIAIHNGGLGLVSMRERVRQVKGSIQFISAP